MTGVDRRLRLAVVAVLVALAAGPAAGAATASTFVPAPVQELTALLTTHQALAEPRARSASLGLIQPHRPLTGERTVLPVVGSKTGADGTEWLHVLLPGRPNGRTGWIDGRGTSPTATLWHIVVDISQRQAVVYRSGRRLRAFGAVVGKPSTPTPLGRYFVEEAIELRPGDVGAPYALALSARSYVLQEFAGGPGQIALHGLENVGGTLGTAASHGCIRLADDAIRWLVVRIGPGVPVTVVR